MEGAGDGPSTATNPRGIPIAPFVDRVEDYVSTRADVEGCLRNFQEMISKYQFMQANTDRRVQGLRKKVPDIHKTLETIEFLRDRPPQSEPLEAAFELNETLHARALIPPSDEVYLWLGANVMLAYSLEEAEQLLSSKLSAARSSLANCEDDLDFLREQITTMEVATARVYNWDVGMRRKETAQGVGDDDDSEKDAKASDG